MGQKVKLKDGREVTIREINADDVERSHAFFRDLPEEDRAYLRVDVTDHDIVEKRINTIDRERIRRLVAVHEDEIVADGTLESDGLQWDDHMAELRLIVSRPFQRHGLGMLMARELYFLAARKNVEEIIVKFMPPQKAARNIFTKLGFHEDAVLHDYVKDRNGHKQDLIIMRCNLQSMWEKLESYMHSSDWQRTR
jgi:L-amino acid N-acyltransferase YncA